MVFSEILAKRIRDNLTTALAVKEIKMMGGLTFMVDDKMCVGVLRDDLMVRLDPREYESALSKKGCRKMDFTGRPMKGFVLIGPEGTASDHELKFWLNSALKYNKTVKSSGRKK